MRRLIVAFSGLNGQLVTPMEIDYNKVKQFLGDKLILSIDDTSIVVPKDDFVQVMIQMLDMWEGKV